jgi:aminoglycoside phosphotransferase (APT) family kinase protein
MGIVSANQHVVLTPLAGGVSSDIYRATVPGGVICIKRALGRLKVAADWQVPVERNQYEVEWMRVAAGIVPGAVPVILGEDRQAGAFAMTWLPPDEYPVWKKLLADGEADTRTAAAVGDVLGRIHAATADRPDIAARFATDALFHAIRLDPYLATAANAHPDLSRQLLALVATTASTRRVLVHGDFSPKNILVGAQGPVVLDAECAWYGDPAFDLAFVLNHLLLKGRSGGRTGAAITWRCSPRCAPRIACVRHGSRGPRWNRALRRCCPACCWPASTASRPSNT